MYLGLLLIFLFKENIERHKLKRQKHCQDDVDLNGLYFAQNLKRYAFKQEKMADWKRAVEPNRKSFDTKVTVSKRRGNLNEFFIYPLLFFWLELFKLS